MLVVFGLCGSGCRIQLVILDCGQSHIVLVLIKQLGPFSPFVDGALTHGLTLAQVLCMMQLCTPFVSFWVVTLVCIIAWNLYTQSGIRGIGIGDGCVFGSCWVMCVWGALGGNTRFSIFKDSLIILGHVRNLLGIRLALVWRFPLYSVFVSGQ